MAKTSTRIDWSPEEIGFLAAGPDRAAQAALARLMDGGLVRVSREGLVTAVHQNGYGATTRLEAKVLAGVQGAGQPMRSVVAWAAQSPEMASLRQSLVDRGMQRRKPSGSAGLQVLFILLTVVFFGIGFAEHVFWAFAAVTLLFSILVRRRGLLTPHGRTVLKFARRNVLSRPHTVAMRGLTPGRQNRSTSDGGWYYTPDAGYVYHCGSSSSCSGSSCSSSSGCSSSSSSCGSSSSSSCSSSSSSSSSSCGSSSS